MEEPNHHDRATRDCSIASRSIPSCPGRFGRQRPPISASAMRSGAHGTCVSSAAAETVAARYPRTGMRKTLSGRSIPEPKRLKIRICPE
jgi:hypothetical protein